MWQHSFCSQLCPTDKLHYWMLCYRQYTSKNFFSTLEGFSTFFHCHRNTLLFLMRLSKSAFLVVCNPLNGISNHGVWHQFMLTENKFQSVWTKCGLVAQAVRRSPPTAGVPSSCLGPSMWVSWWTKQGLGRFFTGFLPFSPTTNFIPPFLHPHLIHFVSFHPPLWWCVRCGRPAPLLLTDL